MITCTITSPSQTTRYSLLRSVSVPGHNGELQILSGHAEMFVLLQKGRIKLASEAKPVERVEIQGGECHVQNNTVTAL